MKIQTNWQVSVLLAGGKGWGGLGQKRHELMQLLKRYLHTFKAWKVHDENMLTVSMRESMEQLHRVLKRIPAKERDGQIGDNIRKQIAQLGEKIARVVGTNALAEYERMRKQAFRVCRAESSASGFLLKNADFNEDRLWLELLYDPMFALTVREETDERPDDDLRVCITFQKVYQRSLWKVLVTDMENHCFEEVYSVLEEVVSSIQSFCKPEFPEKGLIAELLDIAHMRERISR